MRKKILHIIIGHVPYWVFTSEDGIENYRRTLCDEYLHKGVYNRLYVTK